jgi:transcriptional regulator with XRE-family HTH domain
MLHAKQIRAARAMLGWGQSKFARATGLSLSTVRNLEDGHTSPREQTYHAIRRAMQVNGLEFTEQDGIRSLPCGIVVFQGSNATQSFYEHVLKTVRQFKGEILAICPTVATMAECFGMPPKQFDALQELSTIAPSNVCCGTARKLNPLRKQSSFDLYPGHRPGRRRISSMATGCRSRSMMEGPTTDSLSFNQPTTSTIGAATF